MKKILFGLLVVVLTPIILLFSYAIIAGVYEGLTIPTSEELTEKLSLQDNSQQELDERDSAIKYIFENPDNVDPFIYAELSNALIMKGNLEQAAFWFYIFQSRTKVWSEMDLDSYDQYSSLRSSINYQLGYVINEWIASDPLAWLDLTEKALAYEKTFPFYKETIEGISEEEWGKALLIARNNYFEDMNNNFKNMILEDGGESIKKQREENGLYVGPWKNPGEPLLDEWN